MNRADLEQALIAAHNAGNAEHAQILAAALAEQPTVAPQEEAGFLENIGKGFASGAVSTGELASLGAAALLEEEDELAARAKIQEVAESLRPEGGDPDSYAYKIASGLGSIAGALAPAAAVTYGAPALGVGATAATIGGLGTAGAIGVGAGAGEASERARAFGTTEEERNIATRKGAAIGLSEILPFGKILKIPLLGDLIQKAGGESAGIMGSLRRALITGSGEAAQEAAAGIAQNYVERGYNLERELIDAGVAEEGLVGGASGAILELILDSGKAVRRGMRGQGGPERVETPSEPTPEPSEVEATAPISEDTVEPTIEAEEISPLEQQAIEAAERGDEATFENLLRRIELEREVNQAIEADDVATFERASQELAFEERRAEDPSIDERRKYGPPEGPLGSPLERARIEQEVAQEDSLRETDTRVAEAERTRSEQRRMDILQQTIDETPTRNYNTLAKNFEQRLASVGITDTQANQREAQIIERAVNIQRAERGDRESLTPAPPPAPLEQVEATPESTQLGAMEARVRERPDSSQATLPGIKEPRKQQEAPAPTPEEPTPAAPDILTDERLSSLGIAPKASARKALVGKDLNQPETQRRLLNVARNPRLGSQQARTNVARLLEDLSGGQRDLFTPTTQGRRSTPETGVPDARVAEPQQVPSGVGVPTAVSDVGAERAVPPAQPDTQVAVAPEGTGVADTGRGVGEPVRGAVAEQPALETKAPPAPAQAKKTTTRKEVTRKARTPAAPAEKKAEVKAKPAPKKEAKKPVAKKPVAKKPAPPKKPTLRDTLDEDTRKELEYQKEAEQLRAPRTYETPESDDPVTVSDIKKIAAIIKSARVRSRKATQVVAKEIKRYLATPERIIDGIAEAIYEDVTDASNYRVPTDEDGTPLDSEATREYMQGHSAKNARIVLAWLRENGSKQLNNWIDGRRARVQALENRQVADIIRILKEQDIVRGTTTKISEKQIRKYVRGEIETTSKELLAAIDAAKEERFIEAVLDKTDDVDVEDRIIDIGDIEAFDDSLPLELRVGETYTDTILHPAAIAALKDGDLRGALAILATTPDKDVARIAKVFAEKIGDTKVEVASSRKIAENVVAFNVEESLAGSFDPKTNTIYLNPDLGISRHALLHEVAHALTSASLSNKSSPTTKQLNKLFDDVKDMLGTAYGTKNLDEFVAEAMSNPQFQADLAGLNPNGSDINALQRFLNSVGNFLRRLIGRDAKDIDSALTRADMLINEILAPAPEYRDANSLAMKSDPEGVKQVMNDVGEVQKAVGKPITKRERTSLARSTFDYLNRNIKDAGSAANATRRKALLALLDLQALGDVAGLYNDKVGLLASEILTTIKEMRGMMDNRANVVSREIAKVEKLLKGGRSLKDRVKLGATPKQKHLDELIYNPEYGATIYQVDPTKERSEYEGETDENGNDLAEVWDAQRTDWEALGKDGQDAYVTMRDMYKNLYNELKTVISERIDSTAGGNTTLANKQKQEIFAKLFDTKALDVYFPLMREGNYKLSYTFKAGKAPKGEDIHGFLMFNSKAERDAIAKELKANSDIDNVDVFDGNFKVLKGQNAPSSTFMKEILQVVDASGADPVVQDQLVRMFVATLPESSFAKSLQRRTGVAGYDSNSVKAMKTKGFDLARQIERMRYLGRIQDLEGQLADKDIKAREGQESQLNEVREELIMRTEFAKFGSDSKFEGIARTVNQIAFVYTIGANAASAAVQLFQLPMFTYPMLGAIYGYDNTQAEMMRASRIVMGAGMKSGETLGDRIAPAAGIDLYYDISDDATSIELKKDLKVPDKVLKDLERLKPLVLKAYRQGDLSRSFVLDSIGLKEGGRARDLSSVPNALQAGLDFGTGLSAMMFNQAERLNRQTTLITAYQLELNRLNKEQPNLSKAVRENMAADTAIYNTLELNTGATLETAPRIAQQGLGRVAMMYKTYGLRMYYTMFKTANKVLEDYRQARIDSGVPKALANAATGVAARQMAGIHGSAVLFSGVHGIPLYGAVQLMFDNNLFYFRDMIRAVADLFEEEETLYPEQGDDFNTIVRNYLGEGWYKGGLNAALAEGGVGADVASRIRLTGLLIQQNRFNPDPSVEEFFGYYLGGPALSVGKRIGRGITDFQEGNFERAAEGMLPAGISNMLKATQRYSREGGIKTRRGDPIYDDMTSGELAVQFFGFAPAEYIRIQEENQNLKNIDRKTSKKRSDLMKNYYLAMSMGTYDDMREVFAEILKFNRANPSFDIDADSLDRSISQHLKSSTKMHNGVQLSPRMVDAINDNRAGIESTFIPPKDVPK